MRQEGAAGPAATITYMSYTCSGGDGWEFGGTVGKKRKSKPKAKAEKKQPKKRGK